jgi:c-di-AMP phosphodiesterase-like protein
MHVFTWHLEGGGLDSGTAVAAGETVEQARALLIVNAADELRQMTERLAVFIARQAGVEEAVEVPEGCFPEITGEGP